MSPHWGLLLLLIVGSQCTDDCHECVFTDHTELATALGTTHDTNCKGDAASIDGNNKCDSTEKCVTIDSTVTVSGGPPALRQTNTLFTRGCMADADKGDIPDCHATTPVVTECWHKQEVEDFVNNLIVATQYTVEVETSSACICDAEDGNPCNDGSTFDLAQCPQCYSCVVSSDDDLNTEFGDNHEPTCREMTSVDGEPCLGDSLCVTMDTSVSITEPDPGTKQAEELETVFARGCIERTKLDQIPVCAGQPADYCDKDGVDDYLNELLTAEGSDYVVEVQESISCSCDTPLCNDDTELAVTQCAAATKCYKCFYINDDGLHNNLDEMDANCVKNLKGSMEDECDEGEICVQANFLDVSLKVGTGDPTQKTAVVRGCAAVEEDDEEECPTEDPDDVGELEELNEVAKALLEEFLTGSDVTIDGEPEANGCTCSEEEVPCNDMNLERPADEGGNGGNGGEEEGAAAGVRALYWVVGLALVAVAMA